MRRFTSTLAWRPIIGRLLGLAAVLVAVSAQGRLRPAPVAAQTPPPIAGLQVGNAHLLPNSQTAARMGLGGAAGQGGTGGAAPAGPLLYKNGPLMSTPNAYAIYWLPNGFHFEASGTAADDARYEALINSFFRDISASSMFQLLTQYSTPTFSIQNRVSFGGAWLDTTAYGHAGSASDPLHDGDIQAAVSRAIAANPAWAPGSNAEFFVYTARNINSCYDAQNNYCTFPTPVYGGYCAYHSFVPAASPSVIYANMSDFSICDPGLHPHNDASADAQINLSSHEFFESVTDPFLNGWIDDRQREIGDLCAWSFGAHDGAGANVLLHLGEGYILQQEWSNMSGGCALQLPPVIYRIRDNQGLTTGGYAVTIDGQGMLTIAGQLGVRFGPTAATNPICTEDGCPVGP